MSRWRTPRSCACCKASASRAPHQATALGIRPPGQGDPPGRSRPIAPGLEPVERRDEAGPGSCGHDGRIGQDPGQGQPAEVGHAEEMEPARPIGAIGMHRDDVGMLEPRQGLRLAGAEPRDLEHDRAIGQPELLGAEDPGERAPAQFLDQPEAADDLARLGEGRAGAGRGGCGAVLGHSATNP